MAGLPALKDLREAKDWSQQTMWLKMVERLGEHGAPSRASLGNWEKGTVTPSVTQAEVVADFFGVTLDQLAGRAPLPKWAASPVPAARGAKVTPPAPRKAPPRTGRTTRRAG
jgi:transcriptional regulator with XRE-family HTH domain